MKKGWILSVCIILMAFCGCGDNATKQTIIEVYEKYSQMHYSTWQVVNISNDKMVYKFFDEGEYFKLNNEVESIEQIKEITEQICTKEFAEKRYYDKYLNRDIPLFCESNGTVYVLIAEVPGVYVGEIQKIDIVEKNSDYIYAKIEGEDFVVGETVTYIELVKEDQIWKVNEMADYKED